ncbi:MAG: protein kinase [Verrucomicrobia bacterium]|nr:protein kinase [Verrucomicrobiota bacterium]
MPRERAERLLEVVADALELNPPQRAGYIAAHCDDDTTLRKEAESLLAHAQQSSSWQQGPITDAAADLLLHEQLAAGCQIAQYEIIAPLAAGGMGEVYLARDRELARQVALKLVRSVLNTAQFVRRFRAEERILAQLNHPNIAQVYGGGVTAEGVPYFAMEYVEGERLDDFCNMRQLTIRERLELFRKVCGAVSYAHQHLVIHRDIKPANVRVTKEGEPKLLDFGIAKVLGDASFAPEQTVTSPFMTLEYSSPEQVVGEPMSTATDIFSLGVVLYELLTGQKPWRIAKATREAVVKAIVEQEPLRPSVAASDSAIAWPKSKLARSDLDNIILTALRKEPERRYASVAQFAEDITRYLSGRTVIAHRDSFAYRSRKFVARHTAAVAASLLVLLSLIGGVIATSREAHRAHLEQARAERRFAELHDLAHSLMFEIHDSVQDLQGATATRQLIVSRALKYLDSLSKEAANNPPLQSELASAYEKIADIQGNPFSSNLGDTASALRNYRQALVIRQALVAANPGAAEYQLQLSQTYDRIGEVLIRSGDAKGALQVNEKAQELRERVLTGTPIENVKVRHDLAIGYLKAGDDLQVLGNLKGALESDRKGLTLLQQLAAASPNDAKAAKDLMTGYNKVAYMLYQSGDLPSALDYYRHALAIAQTIAGAAAPADAVSKRNLAISYNNIGRVLLKEGDATGAEHSFSSALDIAKKLAAADASNAQGQWDVAYTLVRLGWAQAKANKLAEALATQRSALRINEQLVARNPSNSSALLEVGNSYESCGDILMQTGDKEQALDSYRASLQVRDKLVQHDRNDAIARGDLVDSCLKTARVLVEIATQQSATGEKQLAALDEARADYARVLSQPRSHDQQESEKIQQASDGLAACDALIAKIKS